MQCAFSERLNDFLGRGVYLVNLGPDFQVRYSEELVGTAYKGDIQSACAETGVRFMERVMKEWKLAEEGGGLETIPKELNAVPQFLVGETELFAPGWAKRC